MPVIPKMNPKTFPDQSEENQDQLSVSSFPDQTYEEVEERERKPIEVSKGVGKFHSFEGEPELRQGEPPTLWQKLSDIFIDKEAESAKAVMALVDAERLDISPSAALRLRDAIDREVKINPVAAERVVPWRQRVAQSWEIGKKQNAAGEIGYQFIISGNPKYLKVLEEVKFPTEEEIFIPESRAEEMVRSAAKLTPMMLDTALEGGWKGITLGTGFGLITALAGQPELVPAMAMAGFKIGGTAGLFEGAMRKEAGLALMEIIQFEDEAGNQIDPNIARAASFGIGVINAGIEVAQINLLLKTIPGADRIFSEALIDTVGSKTIKQKLLSLAGAYSSTVARETGQEIAQESVNIVMEELSKNLNNRVKGTDIDPSSMDEIATRLRETAIESAQGFAVIAGPGIVARAGGVALEAKAPQEVTAREPISEEVQPLAREVEEEGGLVLGEHEGALVVANEETGRVQTVTEKTPKKKIKEITEPKITEEAVDRAVDEFIETEGDVTLEDVVSLEESIRQSLMPKEAEQRVQPKKPPKEFDPERHSLSDFIRKMGGIKEPGLKRELERFSIKGGFNLINKKTGLPLDTLLESAREQGFWSIDESTTVGGFLDLIREDVDAKTTKTGNRVWSMAKEDFFPSVVFNERGEVNIENFVEVGKTVWREGAQTFQQFKQRIQELAGKVWDKVRGLVIKVWNMVKQFNEQLGERGAINLTPGEREKLRQMGLTHKQISEMPQSEINKLFPERERIKETTGQKEGPETVSEMSALREALRKEAQGARKALAAGKREAVAKHKAKMKDLLSRMRERRELGKEMKALKRIKEKADERIPIEYQERIKGLLEGVDLTTPRPETIERIQSLKEFIDREGVPLGISQRALKQLERLEKTPFREMSKQARRDLLETAQRLLNLGRLKRELQLNKELREKNAKLNRLIQSTVNLDPELSGEKKPTQTDTFKIGFQKLSMDTLHTFRQADVADGRADYKGENARMIKEQMQAEIRAKEEGQRRSQSILEQIKQAGVGEITDEMNRRINVVLMAEQEARGQAVALMNKYGMKEVPELTEQERTIVNIVRDAVGEKTNQIAQVFEGRENLKFPKVRNYFPIKYEREYNIAPSDTINQNRYRTKKTEQGFTIERKPKVEKVPREDFLGVAEEAIHDQEWYIQLQPVLDEHWSLVRTPEYKEAAGEMMWNWWKNQIDIVARRGWSATARANPLLRQIRINLNQAILGFKLSSVVMQPFALLDAMAYGVSHFGVDAAAEIGKEFTRAWLNPIGAMRFIEKSGALRQRKAGEVAVEEALVQAKRYGKVRRAVSEMALKGLQTADVITAAGVQRGLLNILKKRGIENAEQEAEFLMSAVSASAQVSMRPHILASGEMARTWFTFQTFFLNRWGVIYHDLIRTGFAGNWKRKIMSLFGLSVLIAGGLAEDEARDLVFEFTTGRNSNISDEDFLKKVILYLPRQIPALGNLFDIPAYASAEPPAVRTFGKGARGISQLIEGKPISGLEKSLESTLTLIVGMPGTAQIFDLAGRFTEEPKKRETRLAKRQGGTER